MKTSEFGLGTCFQSRTRYLKILQSSISYSLKNCNDEFLLKEKPVPTLFLEDKSVLCGNLVFTVCDKDGKLEDISEEDIDKLIDFILIVADFQAALSIAI